MILKRFPILLILLVAHNVSAQYTLTVGPIMAANPQLGGLDFKNTVYGKNDSLYTIGFESKNEQFTTHSILSINQYGLSRETKLLLEGNNDLELSFETNGEMWVIMYESLLKSTTLSKLKGSEKELVYSYGDLKLKNGEKRFVLLEEDKNLAYLFYGDKQRRYLAHAINTENGESKWFMNVNSSKKSYYGKTPTGYEQENILLYAFLDREYIVLVEATKLNDRADLILSRINKENGQVIDAIKLNPKTHKYSLDIIRYIKSTNRLYLAGRTYQGKKIKSKKPGKLIGIEINMEDLSKRLVFLPDEMNEDKTIWQDIIPNDNGIALIGETFESYTNTGEALAIGLTTAVITGGAFAASVWTDQFTTKDVVYAEINFQNHSALNKNKIALPETSGRMPDLQPFEVGLMARELGKFRYKGQTQKEAVFYTEGYLHFLDLDTREMRSRSIGEKSLLNFHVDFTCPLTLPEEGLLLYNNNFNIEYLELTNQE